MSPILFLFTQRVRNRIASESKGQGLVEYSIIVVLIAVAAIVILSATSTSINAEFTKIISALH